MPRAFRLSFALFLVPLIALLALGYPAQAQPQPSLAGRWEGTVQIPGSPMRLVVDLAQQDQRWVGSLIAPDFGVKGVPLMALTVKDAAVSFGLKRALGAPTFKAQLESDGALKGEYVQGGNKAPFLLKRVAPPQVDFPELSTLVSKNLLGDWRGVVQVQETKLTVILKLPNPGTPAAPSGQLVLVEYGNTTFSLDLWKEDGNKILFLIEPEALRFEGVFRNNPPEITGTIFQNSSGTPLTFHPATPNPDAQKSPVPSTSK
jgi:hypothetical protein